MKEGPTYQPGLCDPRGSVEGVIGRRQGDSLLTIATLEPVPVWRQDPWGGQSTVGGQTCADCPRFSQAHHGQHPWALACPPTATWPGGISAMFGA